MTAGAVGVLLLVQRLRPATLPPADNASVATAVAPLAQPQPLLHILVALAVIIITARAVGALFKHFRQPPVIGEVIAGILLGPSLLARVAPEAYVHLLPGNVAPFLKVIGQIGVILYMF